MRSDGASKKKKPGYESELRFKKEEARIRIWTALQKNRSEFWQKECFLSGEEI